MAVARCAAPGCRERLVYPEGHPKAGKPKPAGTKTCNDACRQRRARAQAAVKARQSSLSPEQQDLDAAIRGKMKDALHDTAVEELRPLVREAMTDDVLRGIDMMIQAVPTAIKLLQEQMLSEDETIAQRAATLLLKYTMGNQSVAPPPTQQAPAPMSVIFNVPRPGDTIGPSIEMQQPEDAEELRECSDCHEHKTDEEFVGASPRCQACFDALHETLRERFAVEDETAPE